MSLSTTAYLAILSAGIIAGFVAQQVTPRPVNGPAPASSFAGTLRGANSFTATGMAEVAGNAGGFRKLDHLAARLHVPALAHDQGGGDLLIVSSSGKTYDLLALEEAALDRLDVLASARANRAGPRRAPIHGDD